MGVIDQVQTFAITLRLSARHLHDLSPNELAAIYLSPATNRIAWGWEAARSGEGPNMTWYGWTAMTLAVATVVSFLATCSQRWTRKIPLVLVWLLPILAIPYLIYDLRQWWFHP